MIYESRDYALPKIKGLSRVQALIYERNPLTHIQEATEVVGVLSLDGWSIEQAPEEAESKIVFSLVLLVCECNVDLMSYCGNMGDGRQSTCFTCRRYSDFRILKVLSDED